MTLRQCQILEALLAVEEARPGGNVGMGSHPDEVKRELATFRPSTVSANMIRKELRALAPRYVRERSRGGPSFPRLFTLTEDGRVRARELAEGRARLRREAQDRGRRNREARG